MLSLMTAFILTHAFILGALCVFGQNCFSMDVVLYGYAHRTKQIEHI